MIIKIQNKEVLIDKDDYTFIKDYNWRITNFGYVQTTVNSVNIFLHRMILDIPKNMFIDHINMNKLDNRKCNLRPCTKAQNSMNRNVQSNNSYGYTGISYDKRRNKYRSYIKINGRQISLGYYKKIKDAITARINGELKYFKDFCNFNIQREICKKYNICYNQFQERIPVIFDDKE